MKCIVRILDSQYISESAAVSARCGPLLWHGASGPWLAVFRQRRLHSTDTYERSDLLKWLSYREAGILERALRVKEAREVMNTARRIAALILLQPKLDANYQKVKAAAFAGSESTFWYCEPGPKIAG